MDAKTAPKRQKYPSYRHSGIEWLGEVPRHWDVLRLKYSAELVNEKVNGAAGELLYTGLEHIESWTGKRLITDAAETSSDGQASIHRAGDVLFGKLRPYLAKAYAAESDGVCTGELLVLRPKALLQCFLRDYLLNLSLISLVDSSTYGAKMPRANWDFIGNLPALVPPHDEQRAIGAFLDRETARIDALIEKKRRQIKLLHEKRVALISRAVTKGLDAGTPMKDSGVEWLREMPWHWDCRKLKHIATVTLSNVDKKTHEIEEPVRLCNYVDVYYNERITSDLDFMEATATHDEISKFSLRSGDVLITKDSEAWDDIAVPAYVPSDLDGILCGYHLAQVRPRDGRVDGEYLFRAFLARRINDQFRVAATGITRYGLGKHWIDNALFLVPPSTSSAPSPPFWIARHPVLTPSLKR